MSPSEGRPGDTAKRAPDRAATSARLLLLLALLGFGSSIYPAAATTTTRIAVLEVELVKADYLPGGITATPDEARRMRQVASGLREGLRSAGYDVADGSQTQHAIDALARGEYLHRCNGCELDIAKRVKADWVAVVWVQLVSYLIQNLNVVVYETESGKKLADAFVDLRGNTDVAFERATRYVLDNLLLQRLSTLRP